MSLVLFEFNWKFDWDSNWIQTIDGLKKMVSSRLSPNTTLLVQVDANIVHNSLSFFSCAVQMQNVSYGACAIFLGWINLLLFIQKIPTIGIYVVMFIHFTKTFLKFSIVFVLFVVAFGLSFHLLLGNSVNVIVSNKFLLVGSTDYPTIPRPLKCWIIGRKSIGEWLRLLYEKEIHSVLNGDILNLKKSKKPRYTTFLHVTRLSKTPYTASFNLLLSLSDFLSCTFRLSCTFTYMVNYKSGFRRSVGVQLTRRTSLTSWRWRFEYLFISNILS